MIVFIYKWLKTTVFAPASARQGLPLLFLCVSHSLYTLRFLVEETESGRLPRQARDKHTNGTGSGHTLKEEAVRVCFLHVNVQRRSRRSKALGWNDGNRPPS